MATFLLPTHAYIPGQTARHPEDAFDAVRRTAQAGMTHADLAKCDAFQTGLHYIETGFYWEAHEVLEPVWMVLENPSDDRQFVQALIQIANAFLKLRMERPKAALRLVGISRALLSDLEARYLMGVERGELGDLLDALEAQVGDAL